MNGESRFTTWTRRQFLAGFAIGGASLLSGCAWDGHFDILGYTTRPNFDENNKTIYVPIFGNKALQTTPYRGMEMELTRAVIREIEWKSKMKVISDPNRADTELLGTIMTLNKQILNPTQQNEVREGNLVVGLELVWRDLRTNKVLTNPRRPIGIPLATELPPFDPDNPPLREDPDKAKPVLIAFSGRFLPEVGESNATAQQRVCDAFARQIVNLMEKDWELPPRRCP